MFGIGNQTVPLPMPADGRLFLAVNDDCPARQSGRVPGAGAAGRLRAETIARRAAAPRPAKSRAGRCHVRRSPGACGTIVSSYARVEGHAQPAAHDVSDEGQPADGRTGNDRVVGRRWTSTADPRARARARRSSSCTTGRRTPTARSTSARPSTRSSRTSSSSRARWRASTRPTSRATTATGCQSS